MVGIRGRVERGMACWNKGEAVRILSGEGGKLPKKRLIRRLVDGVLRVVMGLFYFVLDKISAASYSQGEATLCAAGSP